jgi:hypothetical protein
MAGLRFFYCVLYDTQFEGFSKAVSLTPGASLNPTQAYNNQHHQSAEPF